MNNKQTITALVFAPIPAMREQFIRPLEAHVDVASFARLLAALEGVSEPELGNLTEVTDLIIAPAECNDGLAKIPGGWHQERLAFNLSGIAHSEIPSALASSDGKASFDTKWVLSGYTNNEVLDNDSRLYFNALTLLDTPNTRFSHQASEHCGTSRSFLFTHGQDTLADDVEHTPLTTIMPRQVFEHLTMPDMNGQTVIDLRAQVMPTMIRLVDPLLTQPGQYLTYLVRSCQAAHFMSEQNEQRCLDTPVADAGYFGAGLTMDVPFGQIHLLDMIDRNTTWRLNGYVTFGELQALFPETINARMSQASERVVDTSGAVRMDLDNQTGSLIANLTNSVQAIAMSYGLAMFDVYYQYDVHHEETMVHIDRVYRLCNDTPLTDDEVTAIREQLFNALFSDSQCADTHFQFEGKYRRTGVSSYELSQHECPPLSVMIPSFASALFTPALARNEVSIRTLSGLAAMILESELCASSTLPETPDEEGDSFELIIDEPVAPAKDVG